MTRIELINTDNGKNLIKELQETQREILSYPSDRFKPAPARMKEFILSGGRMTRSGGRVWYFLQCRGVFGICGIYWSTRLPRVSRGFAHDPLCGLFKANDTAPPFLFIFHQTD